jgi:hypothetical protein
MLMVNRLIPMARKVFGLFVDDGSLALSILVWIFALHVVAPIAFIEQTWAAPVLFLGCAGISLKMCCAHRGSLYPLRKLMNGSVPLRDRCQTSQSPSFVTRPRRGEA